jgi:hypothetical protein
MQVKLTFGGGFLHNGSRFENILKDGEMMKNSVIGLMILAGALSRLLPHTPNVTAVTAIAILGGAFLSNRWLAMLIPVAALFLSDLVLGLHSLVIYVYFSVILIAFASTWTLKPALGWLRLISTSVGASVFFFIVTNFGVWMGGGLYEKTWDGFVSCYIMALPFLGTQVAGDLFYSAVLFGAVVAIRSWKPELLASEASLKSNK